MRMIVIAVVVAAALAGCGGGDDEAAAQRPADPDRNAMSCPQERDGTGQFKPAADALDARKLIGKSLADARAAAEARGCTVAEAMRDGAGQPVSADLDMARILVATEDGIVTEIRGVGGP